MRDWLLKLNSNRPFLWWNHLKTHVCLGRVGQMACLGERSCPGCDIPSRSTSFCTSCTARRSPVGRTYLQEELGIDGWVD